MFNMYAVYGLHYYDIHDDESLWERLVDYFVDHSNEDIIFGSSQEGQTFLSEMGIENAPGLNIYYVNQKSETDGLSNPGDIIVGYGLGHFPNTSFEPPPEMKMAEWFTWAEME